MIKIWAKTVKNHKITGSYVYESFTDMVWSDFPSHVMNICGDMDIPTPVIIKTHIIYYAKYRTVKFFKDDFVEKVDFDFLLLENEL